MCGIAGFTSPGPDAGPIIGAMLSAIAHRGPDGAGQFIDRSIAFGHLRLAILDLAGGAQPRVDAATGDALVFNGEIYGFRDLAAELRQRGVTLRDHSDTEVLFHLLRLHGVNGAIARIDGMFAFAWRDGKTGELSLARDRFGEKPLYYGVQDGTIVFGSESAAVLAHPAFAGVVPDILAAYQLLQFEYVPGTASGWQGVAKLAPGTVLTFRNSEATTTRYWQPSPSVVPAREEEAVECLDGLLTSATRRQLVADVELGVFLSGGVDSSLITAVAAREAPDILALTVRVGGKGFDETPFAAEVAGHLGVRHEIVDLSDGDLSEALDAVTAQLSEPMADASLLPTWLVCRAARRSMKVALGGDGADELMAGYPNFRAQAMAPLMRLFPAMAGEAVSSMTRAIDRGGYMNLGFRLAQLAQGFGQPAHRQSFHWMAPFSGSCLRSIWRDDVLPAGVDERAFATIDAEAARHEKGGAERLLHQLLTIYLPDNILMKTDRASMFNGLEVRAPYLDRAFADYACALPMEMKLRGGGKYILKQLARRYLPDSIIARPKHGFGIPVGDLLRGLFRERCMDTLLGVANPVASWFRPDALRRLVDEHMRGTHNHGKRLWALYVLFTVAARRRAGWEEPYSPDPPSIMGPRLSE